VQRGSRLLGDDPAGDPGTAVAGRIGLLVVGRSVDDDRGAGVAEERGGSLPQGHRLGRHVEAAFTGSIHDEVWQVSGVGSGGVHFAVLLASWMEVPARRCELGRYALTHGVDVQAMGAWRQPITSYRDPNALGGLDEGHDADVLAI